MKQIVLNIRNKQGNTDIAFPCTEEELHEALKRLGKENSPGVKGYVSEVVEPEGFVCLENQELDLDEINYLAKLMDSEDETEKTALFTIAAYEGYETPKELINLHFNLGCYTLMQETDDMAVVGRRYLYSVKPCIIESMQRMKLAGHESFEKIAEEVGFNEYSTFFRTFKTLVGISPNEYKDKLKNNTIESLHLKTLDEVEAKIDRFRK